MKKKKGTFKEVENTMHSQENRKYLVLLKPCICLFQYSAVGLWQERGALYGQPACAYCMKYRYE